MGSALNEPQPSPRAHHGWRIHLAGGSSERHVREVLSGASLPEMFHATARREPARPALLIGREAATHGDLDARAGRIGAWLHDRGISPGDVVIISAHSSVAMVAGYLGVLRAGAIVLLVNPTLTEAELAALVEDSRAVAALAGGDGLVCLAALRARRVGQLGLLISVSGEEGADAALHEATEHVRSMDALPIAPTSPALLAYTSGTTGQPKSLVLSHENLSSSIMAAMLAWLWRPDDVLVHALPLFHQHGLSGVHASLLSGSRTVVLDRFDPQALWSAMAAARASVLFAVPAMYERLVQWAQAADPDPQVRSDLRLAVSGSAPLPVTLAERVRAVLGQLPLERYGTTESGLMVSNPYLGPRRPGTVGLPLPGVELAVVDGKGKPVEDGADGEIVVRGPQVFSGYRGAPEATAASFFKDGWFRSGDIGRIDPADGYLSITGRLKDLIITGGMNVYPTEVEVALELSSGVSEAAVVGVPSQRWGEEVVAVVVPSDDSVDPEEILVDVRRRLSPYKCPKRILFAASLPRNPMGKLLRRNLAEVAAQPDPGPT